MVVAYDPSEYRRTADVIEKLFSLFCPTWRTDLKMFARLFRIEQVKALKKSLVGVVYEQEKEEKRRNVFLAALKIPKLKQIFEQSIAYEASL